MSGKQKLGLGLKADLRPALLGRLRMAEWIEMPEEEFAREIEQVEKDPLFQKLHFGEPGRPGVIRRQSWPHARLSGSFTEIDERVMSAGQRVAVEELVEKRKNLLPLMRKMGAEAFERYFLRGEDPVPLQEIARRTGLTLEQVESVNELLLEIGAEAEFAGPARDPGLAKSYRCIARLSLEGDAPEFEFYSPYWARGLYSIRYDLLEDWKSDGRLDGAERRKLGRLLKRLETINVRQSTVFRILESLVGLQAEFLRTQDETGMRPVSLRQLAHRLDLAPSTVSRALAGRSVLMPWEKEKPLITLVPGRRHVLREILGEWLVTAGGLTDAALAERLRVEKGIKISRRTVNAVRHELGRS